MARPARICTTVIICLPLLRINYPGTSVLRPDTPAHPTAEVVARQNPQLGIGERANPSATSISTAARSAPLARTRKRRPQVISTREDASDMPVNVITGMAPGNVIRSSASQDSLSPDMMGSASGLSTCPQHNRSRRVPWQRDIEGSERSGFQLKTHSSRPASCVDFTAAPAGPQGGNRASQRTSV